ncbi:UvrD-helicase domain-containing protein [Nocardia camponoti]|uniref:DNA helicase n=1 Tax=Nocardia camponoti TaxID=1616106 RepID=A0A917VCV8_9NOCA|nr:UvrD-helicase domain-containing protein [Nocardia camponoti]GGK62184.1 DNA helicase [Nocardia camponoti]
MANIHRERIARWAEQQLAEQRHLPPQQRRLLTGLLTTPGWHLLLSPRPPSASRVAAYALSRTGVFALTFVATPPSPETLLTIRREAEQTFARLSISGTQFVPHSIELVFLVPYGSRITAAGRYLVANETNFVHILSRRDNRMRTERVAELATAAAEILNSWQWLSWGDAPRTETIESTGLFAAEDIAADARLAALRKPFSDWMTFLDPEQLPHVTATFTGPARISGPAGTGKSVVALHRMAHFVKRNSGRVLFTTFVKTLPAYHRRGFARLAPDAANRAVFLGLHAWAMKFLNHRGVEFNLDTDVVDVAFKHAWTRSGKVLGNVKDTDIGYWRDEISRVIKGRGIATKDVYKRVPRKGRDGISLVAARREYVWENWYLPYQRTLDKAGAHDFDDIIALAVAEITARPLDSTENFAMVVVDEVQDFTLMQLRLVHLIAGGGPDAQLLLVGDGQQQVYAGGCTLSEAGISLAGARGRVLRKNYRNCEAVLTYSQRIEASNAVDDLDGGAGIALRDSPPVLPGGRVVDMHVARHEVDGLLPNAIRAADLPPDAEVAVIVNFASEAARYLRVLQRAGFSTRALEAYDGSQVHEIKVGTVHRAKGMDFAAVFHVTDEPPTELSRLTGGARDRAEMLARQLLVATSRARDYLWVAYVVD